MILLIDSDRVINIVPEWEVPFHNNPCGTEEIRSDEVGKEELKEKARPTFQSSV
jgi:hypothetical protein